MDIIQLTTLLATLSLLCEKVLRRLQKSRCTDIDSECCCVKLHLTRDVLDQPQIPENAKNPNRT